MALEAIARIKGVIAAVLGRVRVFSRLDRTVIGKKGVQPRFGVAEDGSRRGRRNGMVEDGGARMVGADRARKEESFDVRIVRLRRG